MSNKNSIDITGMYLQINYTYSSYDDDFNDEFETPEIGYYLSTLKDTESCSTFLVFFHDREPILAHIEVVYIGYIEGDVVGPIKFSRTNSENEYINFVIEGTESEYRIEYKDEEVKCIIPLTKLSY